MQEANPIQTRHFMQQHQNAVSKMTALIHVLLQSGTHLMALFHDNLGKMAPLTLNQSGFY